MLTFRYLVPALAALLVAAAAAVCASGTRAEELAPVDVKAALEKATEAFASAASLRSGHGQGTYKYFEKRPMQREWTAETEADIETFFGDSRFHIDLRYRLERMNRTRRVIIYDKTAILTTRFGQGIRPVGAETEIFSPGSHPAGLVPRVGRLSLGHNAVAGNCAQPRGPPQAHQRRGDYGCADSGWHLGIPL